MDKDQKRALIDQIMNLEYEDGEPWCKVLHLDDFEETHFTGSLADEDWRKHFEEEIATVHNYIKDPGNAAYRKAFMDYFLGQVICNYTPEEVNVNALEDQEWKIIEQQQRDEHLDHIMKRSLDELSDTSCKYNQAYSPGDDRIKFMHLKDRFLEVFEEDALFLINTDPGDDIPAVIGIDQDTIGICFLGN